MTPSTLDLGSKGWSYSPDLSSHSRTRKRISIYRGSKCAFLVLHVHAAIWKEKGLLIARNSPIKHRQEILTLLEAAKLPEQVAVIHWRGHQKDTSPITKGNNKVDKESRKTAQRPITKLALLPSIENSTLKTDCMSKEKSWAIGRGDIQEGPWIYIGQKLLLSLASQWKILKTLHDSFHIGGDATITLVNKLFAGKGLKITIKNICQPCTLYT